MVATYPAQRVRRGDVHWRAWRQAAVIAAPIVAGIALSAGALWRFAAAPADAAAISIAVPPATRAAPLTNANDAARGSTGTIALPPLPAYASSMSGGATVVGALPFSTRLATSIDRGRALECLTAAVYYEAASESDAGQRAVAQVVLNRVRHPAFPATVCGVVYQGSDRAVCQFSFACDGALARAPSRSGWARAARNAAAILTGQVFTGVGLATHYHTYAVTPAWGRSLVMTDAVGAHFFHRWKGFWGTPAAFTQIYRGHEPIPGPTGRAAEPPALLAAAAPVAVMTIRAAQPIVAVQPSYTESGAAISDAASDNLPQSQILDRWKDSGKPLK